MRVSDSPDVGSPLVPLLGAMRPSARRVLAAAAAFGTAFVADQVTGNRWTPIWGSGAIVISLVAVVPRIRAVVALSGAYLGCWVAFNALRALADGAGWGVTSLDAVPRLERWLAGGSLPTATLQRVLYDAGGARWHDAVLTAVYLSFFVVPHAVAVVLLRRDRARFGRYLLATAAVFALGLVGFFLAPTSPPWMTSVAAEGHGGPARRIVPEVLARLGVPIDLGSHGGQPGGYGFEPNPVASMPSVHMAVTALLVFDAWRSGSAWRGAALVYTAAMAFALVYLGEHYVVDMAGGIAIAAVGWLATGSVARRVKAGRAQRAVRAVTARRLVSL